MNIQAALEAARFSKLTWSGCDVGIEDRIPASIREELTKRGHQIELTAGYAADLGGGQAIRRDFSTGVNCGASDPRKARRGDSRAVPGKIIPVLLK
jgi:gamma-glutamyltranspeptidase/glutathione hydrolase